MSNKKPLFNRKHVAEAAAHNCCILKRTNDANYRCYLLPCGHRQEIRVHHMKIGNFKCQVCLQQKLEHEAEAQNCTILGVGKDGQSRHYLLPCGHEQEILTANMRAGGFKCHTCFKQRRENEAKKQGCIFLGAGRDNKTFKYRLCCGHEQEMQSNAVKIGGFTCQQCEDTHRIIPSCVYLLRITSSDFTWLKFGYTKSVHARISQYKLPADAQVEVLAVVDFDTGNAAHTFESSIHKLHEKNKLDSEVMSQYHKSGQTECYPVWMKTTLETTINYEARKQD